MAEQPPTWTLDLAIRLLTQHGDALRPYQAEEVALALDEARRQGIEEAAKCIEGGRFLSDDSPIHREARNLAIAIRTLATKEPTDG